MPTLQTTVARLGLLAAVLGFVALILWTVPAPAPLYRTASFGGVSLRVELATTTVAREKGLGGRTDIPEGYGMLFVFPDAEYYGFWMKDMQVPIDIFWLDAQGQVVSFAGNVATSTYPDVLYPSAAAKYVLETAAGFAREHTIATGTPLLLQNFPSVSK